MNFKLLLKAVTLQAVRSDVMVSSAGSEGHLVLFPRPDMRGSSTALHTDLSHTDLPQQQLQRIPDRFLDSGC